MDIVASNFKKYLELIINSVHTADFVVIDTEFSGLNVGYEDDINPYDQVEDRY